MKIQVTQQDIDCGLSRNGQKCPIALALNRTTGKYFNVGLLEILDLTNRGPYNKYYKSPLEVQLFIAQFDNKMSVKPFAFEFNERE